MALCPQYPLSTQFPVFSSSHTPFSCLTVPCFLTYKTVSSSIYRALLTFPFEIGQMPPIKLYTRHQQMFPKLRFLFFIALPASSISRSFHCQSDFRLIFLCHHSERTDLRTHLSYLKMSPHWPDFRRSTQINRFECTLIFATSDGWMDGWMGDHCWLITAGCVSEEVHVRGQHRSITRPSVTIQRQSINESLLLQMSPVQ